MPLVIRPAALGDEEGIARVWVDACEYYAELDPELFQVPQSDGLKEHFARGLEPPENASFLVAEFDRSIVGFAQGHVDPRIDSAPWQSLREVGQTRLTINSLFVHRSFQRRGIGTQLIQTLEEWAREQGAELLKRRHLREQPAVRAFL